MCGEFLMSHRPATQTSILRCQLCHPRPHFMVEFQSARPLATDVSPEFIGSGARVFVQLLHIERNPACERQVTRTVPGACAGHGLLVMNLEMFRRGQWFAPPPASSSVLITASKLNDAGFWRVENFLKFSICAATMVCIR